MTSVPHGTTEEEHQARTGTSSAAGAASQDPGVVEDKSLAADMADEFMRVSASDRKEVAGMLAGLARTEADVAKAVQPRGDAQKAEDVAASVDAEAERVAAKILSAVQKLELVDKEASKKDDGLDDTARSTQAVGEVKDEYVTGSAKELEAVKSAKEDVKEAVEATQSVGKTMLGAAASSVTALGSTVAVAASVIGSSTYHAVAKAGSAIVGSKKPAEHVEGTSPQSVKASGANKTEGVEEGSPSSPEDMMLTGKGGDEKVAPSEGAGVGA